MTIGEVLDPLNDMIERFSTVMTWVLASLAAQKVLLLLASAVESCFCGGALGSDVDVAVVEVPSPAFSS